MADINDIESTQSVKVIGASSDGTEQTPVGSTTAGELKVNLSSIAPGASSDFLLDVAKGLIPGTSSVNKFGFNEAVGPSTPEDIWDGSSLYVFPSTARTVNISSTSVDDTSTGIGARTLELQGLDSNYNEVSETIILNGTSNVLSVNSYLRLHRMIVRTGGSEQHNVGDIKAISTTDLLLLAQVSTREGQTLMAMYTIPAGKTGYLIDWHINTNKEAILHFYIRPFGEIFQIKRKAVTKVTTSELWTPYLKITEKSDIRVEVKSVSGSILISTHFNLLLVDN